MHLQRDRAGRNRGVVAVSAQRVLATQAALQAAQKPQSALSNRLQVRLREVTRTGQLLAEPGQWDGPEAARFRQATWPEVTGHINQVGSSLDRLQAQAEGAVRDILRAGDAGLAAPGAASGSGANPLLVAPAGYTAMHYATGTWADARDAKATWARPETLRDHVWGGPTRPNGPPHGPDFGVRTQGQYTRQATDLLQDAPSKGYDVKVARDGSVRVYDPATNTFGAYNADGTTKTFFKPSRGVAYWNSQAGSPPSGTELTDAINGARGLEGDARSSTLARIGGILDSPGGRVARGGLTALAVAGDVLTIAHPSQDALGGVHLEQTMAAANLGAMAVTAAPVAELLAANAATDWIPGVGEVVMAGTVVYLAGDLIYQNREAIGHAIDWTDHEVAHVASGVGHDIASGASHAWHSLFG
jgi:hypothetical protein